MFERSERHLAAIAAHRRYADYRFRASCMQATATCIRLIARTLPLQAIQQQNFNSRATRKRGAP